MIKFQVSISLLLCLTSAAAATPSMTLPHCKSKCGDVDIPYPFGIGRKCYYNSSFEISCNNTKPVLRKYNLEVLAVDLTFRSLTLKIPTGAANSKCPGKRRSSSSVNFTGSPFRYSSVLNEFTVVGCDNALLTYGKEIMAGCTSACVNSTSTHTNNTFMPDCYGLGCCQTTIPTDLHEYNIVISGNTENCTKAFLAQNSWYKVNMSTKIDHQAPVVILWTLENLNCINKGYYYYCDCGLFHEGNPFIPGGCKVVQGCGNCEKECARSENPSGNETYYCNYYRGKKSNKTEMILGASLCVALMLVVLCGFGFWLYKYIQNQRILRLKKKFFEKNGGLLLQQQISSYEGMVEKTIIFTSLELEKATDNFNDNRILGRGGQGTVYKGILTDGEIIAIKMSKVIDESQLQQFINEVVILSQINHRNIVNLQGCCLETEVPLLVYEFISNGNLSEFIHDQNEEFLLSWKMRLQIAIEIAGALAYLHSAASIPIFHRDIKSTNILLDEKLRAKIADFGTSRSIAIEQTHLTTMVRGTFGYLDPEYFQSSQFTEKSDVYSYGVVLVELLTGKKAISSLISEEDRSLATRFISCMKDKRLFDLLDPRVKEEAMQEDITAVANVAKRCLNLSGRKRPTMTEVMMELEGIRMSHMPVTAAQSFKEDRDFLEMDGPIDTTQSSFQSGVFYRNASPSDTAPLL